MQNTDRFLPERDILVLQWDSTVPRKGWDCKDDIKLVKYHDPKFSVLLVDLTQKGMFLQLFAESRISEKRQNKYRTVVFEASNPEHCILYTYTWNISFVHGIGKHSWNCEHSTWCNKYYNFIKYSVNSEKNQVLKFKYHGLQKV